MNSQIPNDRSSSSLGKLHTVSSNAFSSQTNAHERRCTFAERLRINGEPASHRDAIRLCALVALGLSSLFVGNCSAQDLGPRPTRLPLVESTGGDDVLPSLAAIEAMLARPTIPPQLASNGVDSIRPNRPVTEPTALAAGKVSPYITPPAASAVGSQFELLSSTPAQLASALTIGPPSAKPVAPNPLLGSSFAQSAVRYGESPRDFIAQSGMSNIQCAIDDFSPTPLPACSNYHDGMREQWVYDAKSAVPTQSPWIEWGRTFYGDGITPRGRNWFGKTNMVRPQFYLYGDYRTGILGGRNAGGRSDNWASRLNLDLDLRLTDSERFHGFIGPLDRAGQFNRVELVDGELNYESVFDPNFVTAFFEGDLGAMWGGFHGQPSPAELPVTLGLVPLLFQNGIWMEDAVTGAAFSWPARHSRLLNWSNYDWTFFAAIDQVNSAAFGADEHAAQAFGTAIFIEAYGGYIEAGYAFLRNRHDAGLSYHNMTASFTRRYLDRVSNSVRLILNTGQDGPNTARTADGGLFLFESSLITAAPLTVVPYLNTFYGWGRPQSVARAGGSGGILRNTGINFDTDGLNGLATLDTSGSDTVGGSIGVDLIGNRLDRQLLVEASYLTQHGHLNRNVSGDQFGLGARYQFPLTHSTLMRFDVMHGWRGHLPDVYGTRMEYRWKF